MDPAEEIVKYWLQSKGYFLQSSINLPGGKELDILAIHKNGEKLHVEVSVSCNSVVTQTAEKLSVKECAKKFITVKGEVEAILGKNYKKIYVRGRIGPANSSFREHYVKECKKMNIEIKNFEEILTEISSNFLGCTSLNPIIKTVQLSREFLKM